MLIRLFLENQLISGDTLPLVADKLHYISNVMRVENKKNIIVFNDNNGEFKASVIYEKNHKAYILIGEKTSEPETPDDVSLLFAPVKRNCTDLIVEKATELGVKNINPIITKRTIVSRVNIDRLKSISIEAAEQSRRISIPKIFEPINLHNCLENWDKQRKLIFLDETGNGNKLIDAIKLTKNLPVAFLIGPEGGFAPEELEMLRNLSFTIAASLDRHILRAETACLVPLALRKYI